MPCPQRETCSLAEQVNAADARPSHAALARSDETGGRPTGERTPRLVRPKTVPPLHSCACAGCGFCDAAILPSAEGQEDPICGSSECTAARRLLEPSALASQRLASVLACRGMGRPMGWTADDGVDPITQVSLRVCDLVARGDDLLGNSHNARGAERFQEWWDLLDVTQRRLYTRNGGPRPRSRK